VARAARGAGRKNGPGKAAAARDGQTAEVERGFQPLQSKLRPPRSCVELVARGRLVGALRGSTAPLAIVCAPAGWGKTTVLTQWVARERRTTAWLQLDAADNDVLVFLTYLALAIERVAPLERAVFEWLESPAPPVAERIQPAFATALGVAPPFLLVFDDAHLLANPRCWQVLRFVLEQLPAGAQLALGARTRPRLPLPRLRSQGRVIELGASELALDLDETLELLRLRGITADPEPAAALRRATEGWPAGVSLATLVAEGSDPAEWPTHVHGRRLEIAQYLTAEVLDRQPRPVRRFLTRTSILDRLSADLCRAVTGAPDAAALLQRLVSDNLFVSALDDRGEWYRYHHLFAELLRGELERRDAEATPDLHRRAAAWCEEHALREEAILHWLAAGEVARAATIFCDARIAMAAEGRGFETMCRWLRFFSDEQILSHPALTLTAAWLYSMTDEPRAGRIWDAIALGERFDDSPSPDGAVSLRSSQLSLQTAVAAHGAARMLDDAVEAAALEADGTPQWRTGTMMTLGVAQWVAGRNADARATMQTVLREAPGCNISAEVGALGHLSLVEADEGHWPEAELLADEVERLIRESGYGMHGPTMGALCAQARVAARRGDIAALEALTAAIDAGRQRPMMPPWLKLYTAVILGEIALGCGDLPAAERWVADGSARLADWPDAGMLRPRLERLRAAAEERRLSDRLTPAERRVLELLATHLSTKEMGQRLYVSLNTIKVHKLAIYRKLGAHSRSEAVERARELGLLPRV